MFGTSNSFIRSCHLDALINLNSGKSSDTNPEVFLLGHRPTRETCSTYLENLPRPPLNNGNNGTLFNSRLDNLTMDRNGSTKHNVSSTRKKRGFEGRLSITTSQYAKRPKKDRAIWNTEIDEILISLVDSHNKTVQDSSPNLTLAKTTFRETGA